MHSTLASMTIPRVRVCNAVTGHEGSQQENMRHVHCKLFRSRQVGTGASTVCCAAAKFLKSFTCRRSTLCEIL